MKYFLLLFCFSCSFQSMAQKDDKQSLTAVLLKLENMYHIKFSYQPSTVSDKLIDLDYSQHELEVILQQIEQQAKIKFTQVNHRYFTITKVKLIREMPLKGVVLDSLNGTSLPFAHIFNITKQKGTTSNSKGEFVLENVSLNDWIQFRFMGYQSKISKVKTIFSNSIVFLTPENIKLSEILVKNYIAKGFYRNQDGSFSILLNATEAFAGLTEPDILETVQNIPGIHSPDESASNLYIRGGTPDQNLILWDGIKLYQTGHFAGTFSAFNPFVVDKVVVDKSGTSARYGNRIAGLIDIHTSNKIPQTYQLGIGSTLNHADLYLKTPIANKKHGIICSFRRSFNDWLPNISSEKYSEKAFQNIHQIDLNRKNSYQNKHKKKYNYYDLNCKIISKLSPSDRLQSSFLYNQNHLDYSIKDTYYTDYTIDHLHSKNWGINLEWQHKWSNHFKQITQVKISDYHSKFKGKYLFNESDSIDIRKNNKINDVDFQTYLNWQINQKLTSTLGYQANRSSTSYFLSNEYPSTWGESYINYDSITAHSHTLFNEYTWQTKDKLYVNAGIRATHFSKGSYFSLEPRIKIEYSFSNELRFRISAEYKTQAISQILEFETSEFGLENQVWTLANKKEYPFINSKQISSGFLYTKNNWQIDIESYHKIIHKISSFTKGFSGNEESTSNGKKTITGFDCFLKKQIRNFSFSASYSWMNSKLLFPDLNAGKSFPDNFDIRHQIYLTGNLSWKQFKFALSWKFHSGKPYTLTHKSAENNSTTNNSQLNTKRLSNYHRMDLSANYTFLFRKNKQHKIRISCALQNIYNQNNLINRSYTVFENPDGSIAEIMKIDQKGLLLTPNLSIRYWL